MSKVYVVNPNSSPSFEIKATSMIKNGHYYEFANETGIVAFVPAEVSVVLKSVLDVE